MAIDTKDQTVQEIKSAAIGLFSIQLDESIYVASYSQLLVLVKYVHSGSFKDEFLFCSALETANKATGIIEKVPSLCETKSFVE